MDYNFYIPTKLKGISPLIWEQKTGKPKKWLMLPEFNIDLIFNLGKPWTIHSDFYKEKSFNPTANFCFLSGLHLKPLHVEFPHCHMFGIRLNTIAAYLLFGLPCQELRNWSVEGDEVFEEKLNFIQDKVSSISHFQKRAIWLEEFIFSSIPHHPDFNIAMKISPLLDEISHHKRQGRNKKIEDLTGYSRMHTLRIFQKWLGVSPTEALAFRRFEKALHQIHYSSDNLTQIGLTCGYYDQAHFIRGFRQFAHMTPKEYLKKKSEMVGQFSLETG